MKKLFVIGIRNKKDSHIRNVSIVESLESHLADIRAFMHTQKDTAFHLFPQDWEIIYSSIDFPSEVGDLGIIPLDSYSTKE